MDKNVLNKLGNIIKVKNNKKYILIDDLDVFSFDIYECLSLFDILDRNNISIKGMYKNNKFDDLYDVILEYQKTKSVILRDKLFDNCKYHIAQLVYSSCKIYNLPADELLSYAYEGFVFVINNYDNSFGMRFKEYCINNVRNKLLNSIRCIYNFGVQDYLYNNYINLKNEIEIEKGITLEEDISGLDDVLYSLQEKYGYSDRVINRIKTNFFINRCISLDDIENEYINSDEEDRIINKVVVNDVLATINEKKRNMIMLKYGFFDNYAYNGCEIGNIYHMTHKGVSFAINSVFNDAEFKKKIKEL